MTDSALSALPEIIRCHFPDGLLGPTSIWLVLPETSDKCGWDGGAVGVNAWFRSLEWYPPELMAIIWFGDDGIGNLLGWDPDAQEAVLWNPEDGADLQKRCGVEDLWRDIVAMYSNP